MRMFVCKIMDRVKKYILARWRKRWGIVPACLVLMMLSSLTTNDGKRVECLVTLPCFAVFVILFPFRLGDEGRD